MALTQAEKAALFRKQHTDKNLLLLSNVWDTLSARLVALLGFPSLATASAAMALANGYRDGEYMPFTRLLEVVRQITSSVDLPVTVDMERGFANDLPELKQNIRSLIEAGAIGLNFEDGTGKGSGLTPIDEQCRRIEAIRDTAVNSGVPLVINARTDVFIQNAGQDKVAEAVSRANAYHSAGADCFFPVLVNNYDDLSRILEKIDIPLNVFLLKPVSDLKKLERMGVARVSVGPALLKLALTRIRNAAEGFLHYETEAFYREDVLTNDFIDRLI